MNEGLLNMGSWKRDSRDEDLALFHDMRRRERRNFLYLLKDDIDASPRCDDGFSAFFTSASTPARSGPNLLPLDSEKNDYNWLLTPPSTPLFPSLDQDVPIVNLSQRRILTRSASVSKTTQLSYPQEPSPRIIHGGNPSPRRSRAASTSSTLSTNRGRPISPSLTSRSSPTLRSSSPCRPTTPTGRTSSAASSRSAPRPLTPTLRRNNTSPSSANNLGLTNGRSRGKSLSPKTGPWERSLPGFSVEPPPNLRTTLSNHTIQRGVSQAPRNGTRNRGSFAEASRRNSHSLGYMNPPDGDVNQTLSYTYDLFSSQTSRASVVSSCGDDLDMAESVAWGSMRVGSDSGQKAVNVSVAKLEDPSIRKCVLPAKRQMKPAGTAGDTVPYLSLAGRKSHERQVAQRRSTQTMFRPLLSSAPITSFYGTRQGSMHRCSSSPLMEESANQNGSSYLSRKKGSQGDMATEVSVSQAKSEDTSIDHTGGQEISEKEAGGNSPVEEEDLECQTSLELSEDMGLTKEKAECAGGCKKDIHNSVEQGHLEYLAGQANKQPDDVVYCDMDADVIGMNIPENGYIEDHKGHRHTKEGEHGLEMSKVKEHHVEDHKLEHSVKSLSYLGMTGNVTSQNGAQRVPSDLGSFRKQSPMKFLNTRSHDGSMLTEKTVSCDSIRSDSHSFIRSLASAISNGDSTGAPLECSGDAMEADSYCESTSQVNKIVSSDRLPANSLESNGSVPPCVIPLVIAGDTCNVDSELCSGVAHQNHCSSVNQEGSPEDQIQMFGLAGADSEESLPEAFSGILGESCMSGPNDKLSQQDVLSIFGGCAPNIAILVDSAAQHDCREAPNTFQSRRFSDVSHATSRLATEASERDIIDHPSEEQVSEIQPLKRSVTLEEATDTILFCSSIIHELVYKSASLAIENERQKMSKPLVSKRDFVTLFGFSGAEHKDNGMKVARPRNRKRQQLNDAAVCETSSLVRKQRMVHRRTPALTMRHSLMDRIENAVMGNHEEIPAPIVSNLKKGKVKQGKRVQCRCGCCMM